jgi:nicotinamidase-related amidase
MLGRTTTLMTGVATNLAVEGIVRASVNRAFDMVVVEDWCASYPDEEKRFSIENIMMPLVATVTAADAMPARAAAHARA